MIVQSNKNEEIWPDAPRSASLADQLRKERTRIAKEANKKIRKIDNAISLLESTEAESVIQSTYNLLGELGV